METIVIPLNSCYCWFGNHSSQVFPLLRFCLHLKNIAHWYPFNIYDVFTLLPDRSVNQNNHICLDLIYISNNLSMKHLGQQLKCPVRVRFYQISLCLGHVNMLGALDR